MKDHDRVEEVRLEVVNLRQRLDALAEDYADGALSRAQMVAGSERVRLRLELAEQELARAGAGTALEGLVGLSDVEAAWQALSVDRRRAVIESLAREVRIMPQPRGAPGACP